MIETITTLEAFKTYIADIHHKFCVMSFTPLNREQMEAQGFSDRDLDTVIFMGELGYLLEVAFPNTEAVFGERQWEEVFAFWQNYKEPETFRNQELPVVGVSWIDIGEEKAASGLYGPRYQRVKAVYLDGVPGDEEATKNDVFIQGEHVCLAMVAVRVINDPALTP